MGTSQREQLPPDLVRGRSRFQAWRGRRKPGGRIPHPLWTMATRLARVHGVSRTAAVLGLDYYRLKKLAEPAASEPQSSGPAFVELISPVLVAKQCRFELDNGAGAACRGINNHGAVVGRCADAAGKSHGFLMSGGTFTTIDSPKSTSTRCTGINDNGQIAGDYKDNYLRKYRAATPNSVGRSIPSHGWRVFWVRVLRA